MKNYQQQLDDKVAYLKQRFAGLHMPALEVFDSPPEHYRMRAEFRVWHEGDEMFYAMFEPGQKANTRSLRRVDQFPTASRDINALMPRLMAEVSASPVLRQRWYQVEFLSTRSGDMLVTMIYHRKLDDAWEEAARALQATLGIALIGRSKGQKIVLDRDHVTEQLDIPILATAPLTDGLTPAPAGAPVDSMTTGTPRLDAPPSSAAPPASPTSHAPLGSTRFVYRQPEGAFTQPNAEVCQKMIGWACSAVGTLAADTSASASASASAEQADTAQGNPPDTAAGLSPADKAHAHSRQRDLLELYCGNGNFTLPLARHFRQVLGTEISKTSVAAAQWNIEANQSHNVKIARLSAEEFTEAWEGQRRFRRLQEAGITLADYDFGTVLVDPPRAGVDAETLKLLQRFDTILYISCNPETLRDNLDVLLATHRATRFALFDQFPFTHHIESGVLLQKR
ncbi:MAG: tRNA (uridine(54)-C5)-methyltransferase TrmA [Lautropia sp.]|nr:tRNA (uridine(54)-C5)-methyltransferase TrmA [Lautropia sp.]